MRIQRIELKNIGPHRHYTVDMHTGLTGVLGANGAGKSTLINSIYAALTNDFSRFYGVQADIITNTASKKEEAFIRLDGEHRGQKFTLIKSLRPSKVEFVYGGKDYSKSKDVYQAVTDLLHIPKQTVDKYVFVQQNSMFSFLNMTDSVRTKVFQYLCGVDYIATLHKECSEFLEHNQPQEVVDNSLELQASLANEEADLETIREEGKEVKALLMTDEALDEFEKLRAAVMKCKYAEQELERARTQGKRAKEEIDQIKENMPDDETIGKLEKKLEKEREEASAAKSFIRDRDEFDALMRQLLLARTNLEEAKQAKKTVVAPDKPETGVLTVEEGTQLSREIRDLHAQLEAIAELEKLGDAAVCPHCQQEVSAKYVADQVKKRNKLQVQLDEMAARWKANSAYRKAEQAYKEKLESLTNRVRQAESNVDKLQAKVDAYKIDESMTLEQANQIVAKYQTTKHKYDELKRRRDEALQQLSSARGRMQNCKDKIAECKTILETKPDADDYQEKKQRIEADKANRQRYHELRGRYKTVKENITKYQETLDRLRTRLKKSKARNKRLETLRDVVEVFHWSNLPRMVCHENLKLMLDDINSTLELFGGAFSVTVDEKLNFWASRTGFNPVPAQSLSGGQKVILAVAFRVALDRIFGQEVGMMFLDEPTDGLDSSNLDYFQEALQQLSRKVGDRQLVVITHHQGLTNVFDQVIKV